MSTPSQTLSEQLRGVFGDRLLSLAEAQQQTTIEVAVADWLDVATTLRDHADFQFSQLIDLCGVDYLGYGEAEWDTSDVSSQGFSRGVEGTAGPGRFDWAQRPEAARIRQRFGVVVQLLSINHNRRLRLRCFAPDEGLPVVPSLIAIWRGVNWFEREAFDLYGIIFDGHPDLRRILSDYGFVGYPFRKDFPLIGNVEVRYDEAKKRVVYEPVSIEPRVGVPRTVRSAAPSAPAAGAGGQHGAGV